MREAVSSERILKLAILYPKDTLYHRTERGARVGDIFMSMLQTARVDGRVRQEPPRPP